jgi:6-phosphogluconate dehydrogenase
VLLPALFTPDVQSATPVLTIVPPARPPRIVRRPDPDLRSALSYYDGYRSARLPANLLQGQRDFFGAHTYERVDQPRGKFFHVDWPEANRPQIEA